MSNSLPEVRPWRLIAEELSRETDPKRVLELSHELNEALKLQEFQSCGVAKQPPAQ